MSTQSLLDKLKIGKGEARVSVSSRIPVFLSQCGQASRILTLSEGQIIYLFVEKFFNSQFEAAEIIGQQKGCSRSRALSTARRMISLFVDNGAEFITNDQRKWFQSPLVFAPRRPLQSFSLNEASEVSKMLMRKSGALVADIERMLPNMLEQCRSQAKNQIRINPSEKFSEDDIVSVLLVHTSRFMGYYSPENGGEFLENFFDKDVKNIATEERLLLQRYKLKKTPDTNQEESPVPAWG